jgi:hypothetical protein
VRNVGAPSTTIDPGLCLECLSADGTSRLPLTAGYGISGLLRQALLTGPAVQ